jgi:hypothetical protein
VYSSSRAAKRVLFPFCSKVLKNKLETLELDKMHFDKLPFLLCTMSLCVKNQTKIEGTFRNGLTGAWDTVTQRCGDQACCVWLLRSSHSDHAIKNRYTPPAAVLSSFFRTHNVRSLIKVFV